MYLFHCGSRRQLRHDRTTEFFKKNLLRLSGSKEEHVADPDTLNYLLSSLDPKHLAAIPGQFVKQLLQKRVLESYRFDGEYLIAIDAVKLYSFKERHCEHCTFTSHDDGSKTYFHYVLEAKLIAGDFVFSIASEFLENPAEEFDKQDCETKGAYRMLPRIKKLFPRLQVCLLLDGLYLNQHIIAFCEQYNWSYFITFKEGSAKLLKEKTDLAFELSPENSRSQSTLHTQQTCRWATNLDHHGHTVHVIESKGVERGQDKFFVYITNIRPSHDNIFELSNQGGRSRWKIENQGFNTQKNHGFELEHPYGLSEFAWKNFYLLMQMAHIIEQLTMHSDLFRKLQKEFHLRNGKNLRQAQELAAAGARSLMEHFKSGKNAAKRLLESMRNSPLIPELLDSAFTDSIQIRFSSA
jgi:hypothetical protein